MAPRGLPALLAVVVVSAAAQASAVPDFGPTLESFDYPYPVQVYEPDILRGPVSIAYMDVAAQTPNGRTVLLMHGKNFCSAYWEDTIKVLSAVGFRVVAPDQVGFCKSGKPAAYPYSFHQLAQNTRALLDYLGIGKAVLIGHSMGGMLATRFALMFPETVERLVLVNPIGLEDWKAKGVPYLGVEAWYEAELKQDYAAIKAYQRESYYFGEWKPAYTRWAKVLAGMYVGEDVTTVAWAQAMTYDMIYTEPVVYEFDDLEVPTTLMIGQRDRTAIGKDLVSKELRAQLGNYPKLGRHAAERIPRSKLIEFDGLGHLPFIEAPERFQEALLEVLSKGAK